MAETLRTLVPFLKDLELGSQSQLLKRQLMTTCVTPAPVNGTNRLVHFYFSSARETEAGESGIYG